MEKFPCERHDLISIEGILASSGHISQARDVSAVIQWLAALPAEIEAERRAAELAVAARCRWKARGCMSLPSCEDDIDAIIAELKGRA